MQSNGRQVEGSLNLLATINSINDGFSMALVLTLSTSLRFDSAQRRRRYRCLQNGYTDALPYLDGPTREAANTLWCVSALFSAVACTRCCGTL